jgi:hypothetical protein
MLCVGACLFAAAPAGAAGGNPAAGYPPPTTTTLLLPTHVFQFELVEIDHHFTVEECGFFPVSQTTYTYSMGGGGTLVVDANGCITITIYAYDPHVTINGGALVPANWQGNTIVVVGTGANTAQRTYTLTFNIFQPSSPPASSGSGTTSGSPSGSGSDAPPASSGSDAPPASSGGGGGTATTGTLAFTGTNALATAVAGLLLLVAGAFLVLVTRRRQQRDPH